jgi:hypothetical protein
MLLVDLGFLESAARDQVCQAVLWKGLVEIGVMGGDFKIRRTPSRVAGRMK